MNPRFSAMARRMDSALQSILRRALSGAECEGGAGARASVVTTTRGKNERPAVLLCLWQMLIGRTYFEVVSFFS